ncbi:DUF1259 domain-containing protein [Paenibacillus alginolyticus]|uniref:DUF1259 domain-containing protein n=1 Tax=Paenibacillus alginolyticus TaxID=59839 RepID=UPI0003FA6FC6|nr:DUF1259 domain-containing protein [Paenibacillus alginolyticus]MCY9667417.1 DUF1259 domain-containing protein [Paenibacillus alginolyticus]
MKKLTLFLLMITVVFFQPFNLPTVDKTFAEDIGIEKQPDWKALEHIFSRKGTLQDGVFKVTFPRADLKVNVGDVVVEPGLALTGWLAFQPHGNAAMMMGDLVLLDTEVPPVISKLGSSGIDITALHNHLINEMPSIMFLHIEGHGEPKKLAGNVMAALAQTRTPLTQPSAVQQPSSFDWSKVEAIMGQKGHRTGNLIQFNIPRTETITENKMVIPPTMGVASPINFQSVGNKAAIVGDFVLLANEVNPVIHALTEHGITVMAIHNHFLVESPRLFFMHFWGFDDPEKLARGLKAALECQLRGQHQRSLYSFAEN